MICKCDNCGREAGYETLPRAKNIEKRHEIGGIYSDVECPECHALCFPLTADPTRTYEAEKSRADTLARVIDFLLGAIDEMCSLYHTPPGIWQARVQSLVAAVRREKSTPDTKWPPEISALIAAQGTGGEHQTFTRAMFGEVAGSGRMDYWQWVLWMIRWRDQTDENPSPEVPAHTKWMVEYIYASGWADAEWTEDDEPRRFLSAEAAEAAIAEFIREQWDAVEHGDMPSKYRRDDYRAALAPREKQ